MCGSTEVRLDPRLDEVLIEDEPARGRPVDHPQQRDVGERRLEVAAADVRVDSGEPHLLHNLSNGPGLLLPEGRREWPPTFVDRHGVIGKIHGCAQVDVVERPAVAERQVDEPHPDLGDAETSDRVPDADEFDPRLVGPLCTEFLRPRRVGMRIGAAITVELVGGVDAGVRQMLTLQQSRVADEPREATSGIRAAAESEEEQLVAGLEVPDALLIRLADRRR